MTDDTPLLELGLDSLMAVELRNWMTKELGVQVPVMRILSSGSTMRSLARLATEKQKVVDVPQACLPLPKTSTLRVLADSPSFLPF